MSEESEETAATPSPMAYSRAAQFAEQAQKSQEQAATAAAIEQDVRTNPRYDTFFAPYQPAVREDFVRDYVTQKMLWLRFGDFYERHLTGQLTQFEQEAYVRLWDIQQKKLFDLQCQWRAELVTVEGVQLSYDFQELSQSIENCPVIPPITAAELELYLRFVEQANYEQELRDTWGGRFGWQKYEDVKAAYADDDDVESWAMEEVPGWYFFHNEHTGNEQLLRLPNPRGEKEKRYLNAWRTDNKAQAEAEQQAAPPPAPEDPRPAFLRYEAVLALRDDFARQFESAQVNRQRTAYQAANQPADYEDEELDRMLDFLKDLDEPVSIAAGPDWRLAVRQAAYEFRKRKLLVNLPLAFEAYQQRQQWGIAQPAASDREPHSLIDMFRKGILAGRKLLGEPEDFDF